MVCSPHMPIMQGIAYQGRMNVKPTPMYGVVSNSRLDYNPLENKDYAEEMQSDGQELDLENKTYSQSYSAMPLIYETVEGDTLDNYIANYMSEEQQIKNPVEEVNDNLLEETTYEAEHIYDVQENNLQEDQEVYSNSRGNDLMKLIKQERKEAPKISKEKLTEMIHNELHRGEMLPALHN
ncbi:MAG: hypothetical protein V3V78_00265 [Candidatus Woesearchaeota archaeon]